MMNKIEMEINNNRTMQLSQQKYDGNVSITTYNNSTSEVDHDEIITTGDLVMLINYYRYVKTNNEKCDFINPNPETKK